MSSPPTPPPSSGSSDPPADAAAPRPARAERLASSGPWLALVLLAAWTATLSALWLPLAAAALLLAVLAAPRRGTAEAAGSLLLLAAVVVGFLAHRDLDRVAGDFDRYWAEREARVAGELSELLTDLVDRGDRTLAELVRLAGSTPGNPSQADVTRLLRRSGLTAVALYDADARLQRWAGTHRGRVPEGVQVGLEDYAYGESPLFGHLYFTEPVPSTGGTAVVAALLRADLPEGLRASRDHLVSRFRQRTGEEIRIGGPDRIRGVATSDFIWGEGAAADTLFSVDVVRPAQAERIEELRRRWSSRAVLLLLVAWAFLAAGWRGRPGRAGVALAGLGGLVLLAPLQLLPDALTAASVADFLLPGLPGVGLGRLTLLLLVLTAVAALLTREGEGRLSPLAVGIGVGLAYPPLAAWIVEGSSAAFVAGPESGWVMLQLVVALALSLPAALLLSRARGGGEVPKGIGGGRIVVAALVAMTLAAAAVLMTLHTGDFPLLLLVLWGGAAGFAAAGLARFEGWQRVLLVWCMATILGTTAGLTAAWEARLDGRMAVAEARLERLGAEVDPYLDFLLNRLGTRVEELQARGASPVEVLYRGWLESGLAREGYPVWLTLWSPGGLPQEELRVGVEEDRPGVAADFAQMVEGGGEIQVYRFELPDAQYLLVAPLETGDIVTAVVPPVKELAAPSPFGPLLAAVEQGTRDPITLVPLLPEDRVGGGPTVEWVRTAAGWRGEVLVEIPGQRYHAHYLVELPGPLVLVARATLLLVLNLTLVLLVWGGSRLALLGSGPRGSEFRPLFDSFRARVTLALFAFFVLSNAIFGTLAYRTISGAAERAAAVLAERVAQDAAGIYNEVGGEMELLARQVGTELLEYRDAELREGSSEELVELGLFEGWIPYEVASVLGDREDVMARTETRLGRWEYVQAFRRLPDGDILATPVSLQAGATAVRRDEVAHLLGFAVVAGGLLSLVLAFLVARTLTRPIQTLQVASERVGGGNLGVKLPADRGDEFGAVFTAFNRMVRRLRRARRQLVRTTRRTRAIVEDAATGVIALDEDARVTLANPRAEALLDRELEVGRRMPEEGDAADELVRWLALYYRDGLREAGGEFQFGERRIRVRARRIGRESPLGGAVVSLEDVTDELRTERILAWGEMARQVAHEVKNPLTPIKLSIQHIRRAWEDRRADFEEILDRNAAAALAEIDRLALIASSFSRFGAPGAAGEGPLQRVDLRRVVDEVLALYSTDEGGVRFDRDLPDGPVPVRAREAEVKEVLINLLENARAAVASDGRVRAEVTVLGDEALLRVVDDGTGIDPELLPRIFEPHFSTRSAGTGLGLAIVKRLVEGWEGSVTVESEPGEGTVVTVRLRRWEEGSPDDPSAQDRGSRPGGSGGG